MQEPRCSVCKSRNARVYDRLLVNSSRWSLKEIRDLAESAYGERFKLDTLSRHLTKHLRMTAPETEILGDDILKGNEVFDVCVSLFRDFNNEQLAEIENIVKKNREDYDRVGVVTQIRLRNFLKRVLTEYAEGKYLGKLATVWNTYFPS